MKSFLILGSNIAAFMKDVFPSIIKGNVYCTPELHYYFINNEKKVCIRWYTTITLPPPPYYELTATYDPEKYPKFDNYDAINVDKSKDIPCDYYGLMGVPVSFLNKINRSQFDFIGLYADFEGCDYNNGFICGERVDALEKGIKPILYRGPVLNKKILYQRLIIKRKTEC